MYVPISVIIFVANESARTCFVFCMANEAKTVVFVSGSWEQMSDFLTILLYVV